MELKETLKSIRRDIENLKDSMYKIQDALENLDARLDYAHNQAIELVCENVRAITETENYLAQLKSRYNID